MVIIDQLKQFFRRSKKPQSMPADSRQPAIVIPDNQAMIREVPLYDSSGRFQLYPGPMEGGRIPFARYEGAFTYWRDRSFLPASIQDARYEANGSVRLELLRRAIYFFENDGLVQKLAHTFPQFTVGATGLLVIPSSEQNEEWNQLSSERFHEWCHAPDLCSTMSFGEFQYVTAKTWLVQGEAFWRKTFDSLGKPKLQFIEPHRVGTPSDRSLIDGKTVFDGVEIDSNGRPVAYWVRVDDFSTGDVASFPFGPTGTISHGISGDFKRIPAQQMIHIFLPDRVGMLRGITAFAACMNDLHDLSDLWMYEMRAAKSNSEIANVIINKTGEANTSMSTHTKWGLNTTNAAGNPATKDVPQYYEVTMGGRTMYLVRGDDIKEFGSRERPSAATQFLWDYIISRICASVNVSKLLVYPYSNQGTVVRSDLDCNATGFKQKSAVIARACREAYLWVTDYNTRFDRAMRKSKKPDDWQRVTVRPPRSITVDLGRNSQAAINEFMAGLGTAADWFGEEGKDWRREYRQAAVERAYLKKVAEEQGCTPEEIMPLVYQKISSQQPEPVEIKESKTNGEPATNGFQHRLNFS